MKITTNMFQIQSSMDANYLMLQLPAEAELDEISIKVMRNDTPEFLVPLRIMSVNDEITLKYKLVNATALKYTSMTLPKNMFVGLYLNLLTPFIKGKDWFLDSHNICIDSQYVYCDTYTYRVYFIYIPEKSYHNTDEQIMEFFKKIFINTTISDDKDFQVNLFRYFSNGDATLEGLYQMFKEENARLAAKEQLQPTKPKMVTAAQPLAEKISTVTGKINVRAKETERKTEEKQEAGKLPWEENNKSVIDNLFSNKKKEKPNKAEKLKEKQKKEKVKKEKSGLGGIFGKKKGEEDAGKIAAKLSDAAEKSSIPYQQPIYQLPVNGFEEVSEETEITSTGRSADYMTARLELIDSAVTGAMPRIMLDFNGNYATIGRISSDELKPDIAFPAEFKRIGRRHARIEKSNGKYYVIDLGSMNHTLLNGHVLVPNQPYELQDDMELTFTDSKPVRYRVRL